ncbi:membrane protein [Arenimonas soli]|uniref:Membrane protein n=1 Tax=Arenimonas soli TaxID=2269504 RepID=A0ABQ1HCM0_9GAMM|nr:DUF4105 domain-containing protein [Arenimonas soli]GGA68627.1 membrane protein [Arenimonas soli]
MAKTEGRRHAAWWLLCLLAWLLPGLAGAAPRIGVLTMEPGEIFWERFGHNAIVVDDPAAPGPLSYNFGFFDLEEPGFYWNFVRGRMEYRLEVLPAASDLAYYERTGRGAVIQWLDLAPEEARAMATRLAVNALPENARYTYDYYEANCSTRVRDAIDEALGGQVRAQLSGRSQGNTFRSESVRLAAPATWMALGFHVGLSGYGDRPLSRWDESFIPMRLRDALREVKRADGRPLVLAEEQLLPHRLVPPPAEAPRLRTQAFLAGLVLAVLVLVAGKRAPRALASGALVFWLLAGVAGLVMAFLWFATSHVAAHGNENLLLLSPLCLGLLPGAWARLRGRAPSKRFRALLWLVAGSAAVAGFLKFLPFLPQQNVEWVLLLLPLHWALLRTMDPKRGDEAQ